MTRLIDDARLEDALKVMLPWPTSGSDRILVNQGFGTNALSLTMVTKPELRTTIAMMMFVEHGQTMPYSFSLVMRCSILILYLLLSDKFIPGMTAGALKG
jgi:hypothetical protein